MNLLHSSSDVQTPVRACLKGAYLCLGPLLIGIKDILPKISSYLLASMMTRCVVASVGRLRIRINNDYCCPFRMTLPHLNRLPSLYTLPSHSKLNI